MMMTYKGNCDRNLPTSKYSEQPWTLVFRDQSLRGNVDAQQRTAAYRKVHKERGLREVVQICLPSIVDVINH
ncbi:hypothetical protein [Mastigocladopsis repens]|uniref:hypothetical protein n=1 Tax=Mastigocladopsis repens TaxID=221287 RepID=UPI0002D7D317|nr:hypothetical protein [Mastigocladopsis repens]